MSSGTSVVPVAVDDEGTTVVLGVVEDGGSSDLAPGILPVLTSNDEYEDSDRGEIWERTHMEHWPLLGSTVGV